MPVRFGIRRFIEGNPHRFTDREAYRAVRNAAIAASVELSRQSVQPQGAASDARAQAT